MKLLFRSIVHWSLRVTRRALLRTAQRLYTWWLPLDRALAEARALPPGTIVRIVCGAQGRGCSSEGHNGLWLVSSWRYEPMDEDLMYHLRRPDAGPELEDVSKYTHENARYVKPARLPLT